MSDNEIDRIKQALDGFAGPLNCAQAVAAAFQDISGLSPDDIALHRHNGGGRAPGGHCGALHAALEVLRDGTQRDALTARFARAAGSTQCREIRTARQISCAECVHTAASLLNDIVLADTGR